MGFFNMDNIFFRAMGKLADVFYLSLLWLVFCLPVVTAGASTTAFFYTVHKVLVREQGYLWRSFWGAFKSNFKGAAKMWLVHLLIFLILIADQQFCRKAGMQNQTFLVMYYLFLVLTFFVAVWCVYTYAYTARFEMDPKQTMKNAALLAVGHLPWSGLILLLLIVGVVLCFFMPFLILLLPAGLGYVFDRILDRIFRKYMSEEDLKREMELDQEVR